MNDPSLIGRARLITTIEYVAPTPSTPLLASEDNSHSFADFTLLPNHEPLEIHRSKISLVRVKAGYSYPMIRLPHTFSKLAGLSTHIYQTVHDGALAFLVVASSSNKSEEESPKKSETSTESAKTPSLHGEGRA